MVSFCYSNLMQDQRKLWNNNHANQRLHAHSQVQTAFAEETSAIIPAHSTILELGCGEGNDSIYFANQSHSVIATDFSDIVLKQNKERWSNSNLTFSIQDTSAPLDFGDGTFDVVYARLSLHYFNDEATQKIFDEINRVLKPGGYISFMCKEISDPIYGKGVEIETDMFELDGHVRHFFSERYVAKLLALHDFTVESIATGKEQIHDKASAFIKVLARKPLS